MKIMNRKSIEKIRTILL